MENIYKKYFKLYNIFIVVERKKLKATKYIVFIIIKTKGVVLLNVVIG